jgi:hypothetical protein
LVVLYTTKLTLAPHETAGSGARDRRSKRGGRSGDGAGEDEVVRGVRQRAVVTPLRDVQRDVPQHPEQRCDQRDDDESRINTVMRTVGGSFGAAAATAILTSSRLDEMPLPTEGAYTAALAFSSAAGVLALLASRLVPRPATRVSLEPARAGSP